MAHHGEPSDEQFERAWRELAQPDWGTLAEVRAAARHYGLVRARATALASGRTMPAETPTTAPPTVPPRNWGSMRVPNQDPILDRKRAASGEREDN